jgi:hypothetical protein
MHVRTGIDDARPSVESTTTDSSKIILHVTTIKHVYAPRRQGCPERHPG